MYASAVNEREYYENSENLLLTSSALQIAGDNDENHVRRYQSDWQQLQTPWKEGKVRKRERAKVWLIPLGFWTSIFQHHPMKIHFRTEEPCAWCVVNLYEFHYFRWASTFSLFSTSFYSILTEIETWTSLRIAHFNGHATHICIMMCSWIRYMIEIRARIFTSLLCVASQILWQIRVFPYVDIPCVQSPFGCIFT